MELHKLSTEDLRGYDAGKLREAEKDIRRELVNIRMDIYTARDQHTSKIRGLKKALARLLTLRHAAMAKPAAKGVRAPKAAKPVAPKTKPAKAKPAKPTAKKTATKK